MITLYDAHVSCCERERDQHVDNAVGFEATASVHTDEC